MLGKQHVYSQECLEGNFVGTDALRPAEQAKIDCGREHFKALGNDVEFTVANSYDSFVETLSTVS